MASGLVTAAGWIAAVVAATPDPAAGPFRFAVRPEHAPVAAELAREAEATLGSVMRQLGVADDPVEPILVRILVGEAAFRAAMPDSRITDWAAGVAFPRQGLILLRVDHHTRFSLRSIFRHEVSHIVLARAVDFAPLPAWFVEGVAVHQAGEQILERWHQTAQATLTDSLPPLRRLRYGFPASGTRAELAYAQSTAFLRWLLARSGWTAIRRLVAAMRRGQPFDAAFGQAFGQPVEVLEVAWHRDLRRSASWVPLLTSDALWWVLMAILLVAAALVVRLRRGRRSAALSDDDEWA